jgi:hypothetical protein
MLSRFTGFLTTDGEKEWRNRDDEFENIITSKDELIKQWSIAWECFLNTLSSLDDTDLEKIIYIRNQGHTVMEAINRQLAHYPYHIGQIVYIAKMLSANWQSLSIPKNASASFNEQKFSQPKSITHFTDEYLKNKT